MKLKKIGLLALLILALAIPAQAAVVESVNFSSGLPADWMVVDNLGGSGGVWVDDNPGSRSFSSLSAPFMIADSLYYFAVPFDTSLISKGFDCTNYENVSLHFDTCYSDVDISGLDNAILEISNDGSNWSVLGTWNTSHCEEAVSVDISSWADEESNVKIRWTYETEGYTFLDYWAVDNVSLQGDLLASLTMTPESDSKNAAPGEDAVHTFTIFNDTGSAATIDIAISGETWATSAPASISIPSGASDSVDVVVTVPGGAATGSSDSATIEVSTGLFSDSSTFQTFAYYDWINGPAGPGSATMDGAVVTDKHKIWLIGGQPGPGVGLNTISEFEPDTGLWTPLSPSTHTMELTVAAAYYEDMIYVMAGKIDGVESPNATALNFQTYDISTDSWGSLGSVSGDGSWSGKLVVLDGSIYKIGGSSVRDGIGTTTVSRYDIDAESWSSVASMGTARDYFCAWAYDGKIYVAGGMRNTNVFLTSGEIYDPGTDSWSDDSVLLPEVMTSGACMQGGADDEILIIAGGFDATLAKVNFSYYRDLSAKGDWLPLGYLETAVSRSSGAVVGETAYLINGLSPGGRVNKIQTNYAPGLVPEPTDDDDDVVDDDDDVVDDDDDVVDDDDDVVDDDDDVVDDDDVTDDDDDVVDDDDDTTDDDTIDDDDDTGGSSSDDDDDDDGCCGC